MTEGPQIFRTLGFISVVAAPMLVLWLLAEFLLLGCPSGLDGQAASGFVACSEAWLNRYQQLFSGLLALIAAGFAAWPVWQQLRSAEIGKALEIQNMATGRMHELADIHRDIAQPLANAAHRSFLAEDSRSADITDERLSALRHEAWIAHLVLKDMHININERMRRVTGPAARGFLISIEQSIQMPMADFSANAGTWGEFSIQLARHGRLIEPDMFPALRELLSQAAGRTSSAANLLSERLNVEISRMMQLSSEADRRIQL